MPWTDHTPDVISDFRGWRSRLEETDVPKGTALNARNVRFLPGRVGTREGHVAVFTPTGACTTLYNWENSEFNSLIYRDGNDVKIRFLSTGQSTTIFTRSAYAESVAEAGLRAYLASFNSSGLGTDHLKITDATSWPALTTDDAFEPPMTEIPTVADQGAGQCSKGIHKIGYVLETRSGFFTKPGPAPSDTFTPSEIDLTSDGRTIRVTLDGPYPAAAERVHILMTRVGNTEKYYWTGASVTVPGGQTFTVNCDVSISDENLADKEEATEQFNLISQNVAGTAPFKPSVVLPYGKRMIYVADDTAYISDPEDYQHLTADYHTLILPGRRRIISAFVVRGVVYWLGPSWTYYSADNNGYPSTWAQPEPLDQQIGTLSPRGATTGKERDYGWVVDESGLYYFDGKYADLPISYYNTEWERINWAQGHKVQVVDDSAKQRVRVIAPLDSATNCDYELVWDYKRGKTAWQADFSLDEIADFEPGAVAMVREPTTNVRRRWIAGVSSGDKVLRQDDDTKKDDTAAIASTYRTNGIPRTISGWIHAIRRFLLRVTGAGTLMLKAYSMDGVKELDLTPIDLETTPGRRIPRGLRPHMLAEQASLEVSTNGVDEYFELSEVTAAHQKWAERR